MQFPGPESQPIIFFPGISLVILVMPPIFIITLFSFFEKKISLWKAGVKGAPMPPCSILAFLKFPTVLIPVTFEMIRGFPI